jgi:hypothetical protein
VPRNRRHLAIFCGHRNDDTQVEVFYWVSKNYKRLLEVTDQREKDKILVWYEFDTVLNLGYIGTDLVLSTEFNPKIKKLWGGALVDQASRREFLARGWFAHIAVEIELVKESYQQNTESRSRAEMEQAMKDTHIAN